MKLLLLKHEDIYDSPTFFTELTSIGKMNSNTEIIQQIKKFKIKKIFSSPFLSALQTIYPYCIKHIKSDNDKINIEYSLYDHIKDKKYTEENWKHTHLDHANNKFSNIINNSYQSLTKIDDIKFRESDEDLINRVYLFINDLYKTYGCKNVNVLIVTHKPVINMIKYIVDGRTKIDTDVPISEIEIIWLKKKTKLINTLT